MPVRNTIKAFIDKRGITPYQFGKETGIAQRTAYALYNNPEQRPSPSVLDKICDFYQVQPGLFLEWVHPKKEKDK
jgi:DNA-binding Xre family transcriptional regulator